MTPKEKAEELVDKFIDPTQTFSPEDGYEIDIHAAKQCALMAVDEVLQFIDERMQGWLDADWVAYWNNVKTEIKNI